MHQIPLAAPARPWPAIAMPEKYRRPHYHERVQTVEHMKRAWAAEREALLVIRLFNAVRSTNGAVWF